MWGSRHSRKRVSDRIRELFMESSNEQPHKDGTRSISKNQHRLGQDYKYLNIDGNKICVFCGDIVGKSQSTQMCQCNTLNENNSSRGNITNPQIKAIPVIEYSRSEN